ncbi:ATPase [Pilimelia terevasa]|uniref:ATPase n=1 Tax=Pilimelia terevasa TaxID=53372 RepID=A0A8J3BHU4_9ACTN|nr:ATP-binding protein [Pilimelia terevasa]GGK23216.1 ATPase [Pilimelia terevasa]
MTDALLGHLAALRARVAALVAERRRGDPQADDPFRGLYLSDDAVDALLDAPREPLAAGTPPAADGRLAALGGAAGLDGLDLALLLIALAPDLDSRFEGLFGYLNDDVSRRRASVGLALRLCGRAEADAAGRARLGPHGGLVAAGLVAVDEPDRPALTRPLRVPDRVTAHLLGDDRPDPAVAGLLAPAPPPAGPDPGPLAAALRRGVRLVHLREQVGGCAAGLAAAALAAAGRAALVVAADRLAAAPEPARLAAALVREALLGAAGLVVGPVEALDAATVRALTAGAGTPVLATGTGGWDPGLHDTPPLRLDVAAPGHDVRAAAWRTALDGRLAAGLDPAGATAHFRLGAAQIARAARAATLAAALDGVPVGAEHLRRGARAENAAGLERLARRITPTVGWADLVLPPATLAQLRELCARARLRERVMDQWRMRPGGGRGRGITGLFAGDSGTGKTMSAEVVAAELGLDLYAVNLATVVDKYVGETEKNLERIFTEAAGVNGVLLFDEADAIFGKRSEVRDAHDRYANIESAYLLQRMESFEGLAVLTTNLRANVDDAFTRRLDVVADFPVPDARQRAELWQRCLGPAVPRDGDVDLDFCARAFTLSGGNIRSAALAAAFLAADADRPVTMTDLITAVAREYRKLGRLCLEGEFGPYHALAGV